jgi:hypothetical protein|tara:strand:- start:2000 stop:2191 length:192 start_codon:yes stop_codon:yes gene_type:complete
MSKYTYLEMGSRNKKTNKLPKYKVIVKDDVISDCNCKAREFRQHTPCKHMKNLHTKLGQHVSI